MLVLYKMSNLKLGKVEDEVCSFVSPKDWIEKTGGLVFTTNVINKPAVLIPKCPQNLEILIFIML